MPPLQTIVALGAAGAVGIGLLVVGGGSPQPPPIPVRPAVVADEPGEITVHVSGAVTQPGLVTVPANARIADAVAAAGGALPAARLGSLNLAAPIRDGQLILVPALDGSPTPGLPEGVRTTVRVNTATADELEQLPGVGPVLAERIVAHREARGPFGVVEDLLDVPGIGEAKLASLRDHVLVP